MYLNLIDKFVPNDECLLSSNLPLSFCCFDVAICFVNSEKFSQFFRTSLKPQNSDQLCPLSFDTTHQCKKLELDLHDL
jgi:hypothetical protein